ncbi:metal-dependent hydrolase [Alkalihalobacillus pseudalcaliphilus]|uniref:metal-dependent hydrolase n=1 Tax=Alkalihalobacillus pseudalcaliphilus TaxID=79884 RepID=UPI00064D8F77|nr:metal-dependent hydrolase [Alkalihalobacillus pseudalcaliphilus]KMK77756.1 membrane protein [Alkalihalobacillus pseudalcaliphilus]
MTGKTHIMGGIAASATVAYFTNYDPLAMMVSGAVGGLLPDICHGGSKMGRRFPVTSRIVNTLFGHRTFTHSLLFLAIIGFILNQFMPVEAITVGVLTGMTSHILLDSFTRNGVRLFYPFPLTFRFPVTIRTGSLVENIVVTGFTIVVIYFTITFIWVY